MTLASGARAVVEVTAGVVPGVAEEQHTRRFTLSSREWEEMPDEDKPELLAQLNGKAVGYANLLMLQPDRFNCITLTWLWM